jgi:nitrogen fixation/metabolism regulation signal transduction histidine kinase
MIDLKTVVEHLPIAIFLVDKDRRILLSNGAAKKIQTVDRPENKIKRVGDAVGCSYADENAAGCGFSKYCHLCLAKEMIDRAFAAKTSIAQFDTDIDTRSKGIRSLRMTATYVCASGQLHLEQGICIVTIEDMSELKKKERLAAATETVGAICHEMNQPLQAIMGNAELLTSYQLEEDAITKIDKIRSELQRIKNINNKLLNLTQYQTKPYLSTTILDVERSAM